MFIGAQVKPKYLFLSTRGILVGWTEATIVVIKRRHLSLAGLRNPTLSRVIICHTSFEFGKGGHPC